MRNAGSAALRYMVYAAIASTAIALVGILGYIMINGVMSFRWSLIFGRFSAENPSMSFSI